MHWPGGAPAQGHTGNTGAKQHDPLVGLTHGGEAGANPQHVGTGRHMAAERAQCRTSGRQTRRGRGTTHGRPSSQRLQQDMHADKHSGMCVPTASTYAHERIPTSKKEPTMRPHMHAQTQHTHQHTQTIRIHASTCAHEFNLTFRCGAGRGRAPALAPARAAPSRFRVSGRQAGWSGQALGPPSGAYGGSPNTS